MTCLDATALWDGGYALRTCASKTLSATVVKLNRCAARQVMGTTAQSWSPITLEGITESHADQVDLTCLTFTTARHDVLDRQCRTRLSFVVSIPAGVDTNVGRSTAADMALQL